MRQYETMTDEELIAEFRQGKSEVAEFLLKKYKYLVRQEVEERYLIGGEKDDLIQEGMIGLHKAVEKYDEKQGASFKTFAGICVCAQLDSAVKASLRQKHIPLNTYVSIYEDSGVKDEKEQPPLVETIRAQKDNNPEELFLDKEYLQNISGKVEHRLSSLEKKVLYLHLLGTDYQTIAKLLDRSPKSIDNTLQRIKQKMSMILE